MFIAFHEYLCEFSLRFSDKFYANLPSEVREKIQQIAMHSLDLFYADHIAPVTVRATLQRLIIGVQLELITKLYASEDLPLCSAADTCSLGHI